MGQIILEDGIERELIKVACEVTEDNDQGFVIKYRDQMVEGEVEHGEDVITSDYAAMTKAQLKEVLNDLGKEYADNMSKAELLALVEGD